MNLKIVENANPLPRNLSKCFIRNCVSNTKIKINKESKKGGINSLNMYLFIILN